MKVNASYVKTIEVEINDKFANLGEYWENNSLEIPASEFDACGEAAWRAVLAADPTAEGGCLCRVDDSDGRTMVEY